jgi:1,4-dihydroxy-2-naphthoate octaprenyltransferase
MGMRQLQLTCRDCERKTLHAKLCTPNGWFFLLTLLSALLFWPLAPVVFGLWCVIGFCRILTPWRCQVCGRGQH